jgi:hypothetical protein
MACNTNRKQKLIVIFFVVIYCCLAANLFGQTKGDIEFWFGDIQKVGHLGDAQNDFNLLGHVEPWREINRLTWKLNKQTYPTPLSFRAFRRIVEDGDFNIDIPVGWLNPDTNIVILTAHFHDDSALEHKVKIIKQQGSSDLPYTIKWDDVKNIQDAGQVVDGNWKIVDGGLRTIQIGYDRLFLIGVDDWQDYDVLTSITVHNVFKSIEPSDGGGGVGILLHFTGHTTGGPLNFPSGQPKWGYQPFGAITWIQWVRGEENHPPTSEFYPGIGSRDAKYDQLSNFQMNKPYNIRAACQTLPDENGIGTVLYSFKLWEKGTPEPKEWDWQHKQVSKDALTKGGAVLIAHHVDVTFGDVEITPISD